jgi:hypothetical protein
MALSGEDVRSCVSDLSGDWSIRLDPDNKGEQLRWFSTDLGPGKIALPGTTDQARIGYQLDTSSMTYPVEFLRTQWPGTKLAPRLDQSGYLLRDYYFVGKVWYQREILVPEEWRGRYLRLKIERTLWETRVWIKDRYVGNFDSLSTPHIYDLGFLEPGRHRLTILVDNGLIHNIGVIGHSYGPETQSRWNGIVGKMELEAVPPAFIESLQIHTKPDRKSLRILASLTNNYDFSVDVSLELIAKDPAGQILGSWTEDVTVAEGTSTLDRTIRLMQRAKPWDEFATPLYTLEARLSYQQGRHSPFQHRRIETFGFRSIQRVGREILVNGRRIFLRGTLDCAVYPRTGHPPISKGEWLKVLKTIKEYGLNHVRFHSWCPPEAAFQAADELGIYLAPETAFWVDNWTTKTASLPMTLGHDPSVTEFVRRETRRILEAYGNHPSFAFFCLGNEFGMSSDWELVNQVLKDAKSADPRRLYTATTARRHVEADDYWVTHAVPRSGKQAARTRGVGPNHTNWDFSEAVAATDVPLVSHETGQRPVYPNFAKLLPKFTGPLKPYNYERLERSLDQSGIANQADDFEFASARFQQVLYKAEHEAILRTPGSAGYQLLMLNDFTGQSEALVGILNPFWESKGIVPAGEIRRWVAETVPLARFDKFTWSSDEEFSAHLEVAHYGKSDLQQVQVSWKLIDSDGNTHGKGTKGPLDVPTGRITPLGRVLVPLKKLEAATALNLRVHVGRSSNDWKLWVYPPLGPTYNTGHIVVSNRFDSLVREALAKGQHVLLLGHGLKNDFTQETGFESVFWSAAWWGNQFSSLGVLCDPKHPALSGFPNDGHSDWQWYALTRDATTFLLDEAPDGFRPIVQPIPDFHYNRLLAHVFEARVADGGLLVCGYDLSTNLLNRPAARHFLRSLLQYMDSPKFSPAYEFSSDYLEKLLAPSQPTSGASSP